jgi:acyl carrier protein
MIVVHAWAERPAQRTGRVSCSPLPDLEGPLIVSDVSKVDAAFRESLGLPADLDLSTAAYGRLDAWDSVAHMQLVAALEDAFGIMIETDDVIAMSDYPTVLEILRTRYDVAASA